MANNKKQQTWTASYSFSLPSNRIPTYVPFRRRSKKASFRASVLVAPLAASTSDTPYGKYHIMPNMTKKGSQTPTLNLGQQSNFDGKPPHDSPVTTGSRSPLTPKSALSSPASTSFKGSTIRPITAEVSDKPRSGSKSPNPSPHTADEQPLPPTPGITAIPPYPPSPRESTKHGSEASKSLFASFKSSKSSHRTQPSDGSSAQSADQKPVSRGSSRDRSAHKTHRGRNESTSDLPTTSEGDESGRQHPDSQQSSAARGNKKAEDIVQPQPHNLSTKRSKPRFANFLNRTKSIRVDDPAPTARPSTARRPSAGLLRLEEVSNEDRRPSLRTAPIQNEGEFKKAMDASIRNRSADRASDDTAAAPPPNISTTTTTATATTKKERGYGYGYGSSRLNSASAQATASSLFNNLKQSSSGAADRLGKAGNKWFGKVARSGSGSGERDVVLTDDNYVCSVINLPLVDQAKRTRISKRLEDSKDKTEFWMPALPWRCIDYLNFKGCEEEGLYRIPGSGRDVKHWQRRFDTELDIDLFEEPDLYDINIIGSMFKAWLRELPDEIFPKDTQAMIADKYPDATTAPQLLKDELSKLPPYNYYLLFAITCHLSLLHSYVEQNKMDYRNLCICFQPCMKIDSYCFHFLVCDWKNCWQGCWTEKEYLEKENEPKEDEKEDHSKEQKKQHQQQPQHQQKNKKKREDNKSVSAAKHPDESAVISSSSSSKSVRNQKGAKEPNGEETRSSTRSSSPKKGRKTPPASLDNTKSHSRSVSQLPELGPPLSPIKI